MSETEKNYTNTNNLPGEDFFSLPMMMSSVGKEALLRIVSDINLKNNTKLMVDEEMNIVGYGKDAEFLQRHLKDFEPTYEKVL